MRTAIVLVLVALARGAAGAAGVQPLPIYEHVVGREETYVVAAGDTLGHIAAGFGMRTQLAATINGLADPNRLRVGQRLVLSDRHIVPVTVPEGIVINVGDLRLYWMHNGDLVGSFPVGVGRAAWETPRGRYRIVSRRRDPTWHVPASIRREMRERGEPVRARVPPGPNNPLGRYWLQLSVPGYGIHGTNAPWTVGKYTTHGCIRLRPEDVERLYDHVPNGMVVDIIDEPVKLARLAGDRLLLEAHRGAVPPAPGSTTVYMQRLEAAGVMGQVDAAAAERVLTGAWGIAIDVSKAE